MDIEKQTKIHEKLSEFCNNKTITVLAAGTYVIENFKELSDIEAIKEVENKNEVFYLAPYGDCKHLLFQGKKIYENNDPYETSEVGGCAVVIGEVPKGTLLLALDDD